MPMFQAIGRYLKRNWRAVGGGVLLGGGALLGIQSCAGDSGEEFRHGLYDNRLQIEGSPMDDSLRDPVTNLVVEGRVTVRVHDIPDYGPVTGGPFKDLYVTIDGIPPADVTQVITNATPPTGGGSTKDLVIPGKPGLRPHEWIRPGSSEDHVLVDYKAAKIQSP